MTGFRESGWDKKIKIPPAPASRGADKQMEQKIAAVETLAKKTAKEVNLIKQIPPSDLAFEALACTQFLRDVLTDTQCRSKHEIEIRMSEERKAMEPVLNDLKRISKESSLADDFSDLFKELEVTDSSSDHELRKCRVIRLQQTLKVDQKITAVLKAEPKL